MHTRRRGNRLKLDEPVEMTLIEPEFPGTGPLIADEMSYEFGRKYGIYLNLLLSGLRFTGKVDLSEGQKIAFRVPGEQEALKGSIVWKKPADEKGEYSYGVQVSLGVNRRRSQREDLEDRVEMILIEPAPEPDHAFIIEEMSYGLGRKHGVHLSPHITGLRFRSNAEFRKSQELYFRIPSNEDLLKGMIVWKERADETYSLYGVQIS